LNDILVGCGQIALGTCLDQLKLWGVQVVLTQHKLTCIEVQHKDEAADFLFLAPANMLPLC
jgi:hypothetical protein